MLTLSFHESAPIRLLTGRLPRTALTGGGELLFEEDQVDVLQADRVQGPGLQQFLHQAGGPRLQPCPGGQAVATERRRARPGSGFHKTAAVANPPEGLHHAAHGPYVALLQQLLNIEAHY